MTFHKKQKRSGSFHQFFSFENVSPSLNERQEDIDITQMTSQPEATPPDHFPKVKYS